MRTIHNHVPGPAVEYCIHLSQKFTFKFRLSSNRKTKAGDYKYLPGPENHHISVNKDLNKYAFLITYIHEIAHLVAYEKFGRKIDPHGAEWKSTFKKLILPTLTSRVYPDRLIKVLARHLKNPKASTQADPQLVKALQAFDIIEDGVLSLDAINDGSVFELNGKTYQRMERRRTRFVCKQIPTDKKYLVAGTTLVSPL